LYRSACGAARSVNADEFAFSSRNPLIFNEAVKANSVSSLPLFQRFLARFQLGFAAGRADVSTGTRSTAKFLESPKRCEFESRPFAKANAFFMCHF